MPHYDYASAGVYFVTLCTHGRRFFFNRDHIRRAAEACWLAIPEHNPNVTLDEWVLMPNHLHGLIQIHEAEADHGKGVQLNAPTPGNAEAPGPAPAVDGISTNEPTEDQGQLNADPRRGVQLNASTMISGDTPGTASIADSTSSDAFLGDQGYIAADPRRGVQLNAPTTENNDPQGIAPIHSGNNDVSPSNHFSAISPRAGTLSVIVRTYKAAVTTACRTQGFAAFQWQRGFYEHVVRNPRELDALRRYIRLNPQRWDLDRDNPANNRRLPLPATINDYLADLGLD